MRFRPNGLMVLILVGCFVGMWREHTARDVAVAQGREPVVITRIFTGPDGLAHAGDIELKVSDRGVSEMRGPGTST